MRGREKEEDERDRERESGKRRGGRRVGRERVTGRRGRAQPCGWWRLDLLLDRDLRGGWGTCSNLYSQRERRSRPWTQLVRATSSASDSNTARLMILSLSAFFCKLN